MRPVRVLWVLKELAIGGAERLLLEMSPSLEGKVEFHPVAVSAEPRTLEEAYRLAGFRPVILGARSHADVGWVPALRQLTKRISPDVVHLHNPLPGAGGRLATIGLTVPVLYTEHNLWRRYHLLSRWANALTLWRNDAVVAVSSAVRDSILSSWLGRRVSQRLLVVPNGIAVTRVREDAIRQTAGLPGIAARPAYGAVGHLRFWKGVDVLLEASKMIQRDMPDARGYVVGVGEDARELERVQARLGANSVQFLGLRQDARALIARLDVFVVPSRAEGLPLALLEAMALGRPIVATKVGGIPNVLTHERDALLVSPGDPVALAGGVVRLLRDRELAGLLGERAREVVEKRFAVERTAKQYMGIYEWVLRSRERAK
jgi:L-malate glycosyltransferase